MTYFSLLPLDVIGNHRGPAYLKWRYRAGLDCHWSLKDMGNIGLIASNAPIPQALPVENKRRVCDYLKSNGIEYRWIAQADNQRELVHRLAGLTQAYQANDDNPAIWLHKDVHFGFMTLGAIKARIPHIVQPAPRLNARGNFRRAYNWRGLLALLALLPFAALPATDAFTAANGTDLTTYSANWTYNTGAMQINTNAVAPNTGGNQSMAHWNADAFADDQYSELTVAAITSAVYIGPAVRCSVALIVGYYIEVDSADGMYLFKQIAAVETQLGSKTAVVVANDVLRLTATGTTISPKKNGASTGTPGDQTDASIASGSAGINGYDAGTGSRMDTWTGNNVSAAGAVGPLLRGRLVKHGILQGRLVNA